MPKTEKQQKEETEPIQWHRLGGMVLKPLFKLLGYNTDVEVDVSKKQQLLDIIVVRKEKILPEESGLPKIYWETFGELNEHNLISFKSFRESFNGRALMEFFGYLISYHKENEVELDKINLYVMTHHYPRKLLRPLRGTEFFTTIKKNEIYDLKISTTQRIRFVILRTTDHPVLGLFSNSYQTFTKSYQTLQKETELLDQISIYFSKMAEYYGEEVKNVYTEEDFWRDYPPTEEPFLLPWQKEYYDRKVEKAAQQAAQQAAQAAQQALSQGEMKGKMETAKALLLMGMDVSMISKATALSEEQILSLKGAEAHFA